MKGWFLPLSFSGGSFHLTAPNTLPMLAIEAGAIGIELGHWLPPLTLPAGGGVKNSHAF